MYMFGQGPNPRTEDKKTRPLGSVLASEEVKSDQSHLGGGSRKNPSSASQG